MPNTVAIKYKGRKGGEEIKMIKFNSWTKACSLVLLWAATAVALPAQTFTVLHSFNGADGNNSQAPLVQATNGDLYGSTVYAGANGLGTIFKMTTSGTVALLHSFDGTDGTSPWNALVQGTDGDLYGTTYYGGFSARCIGGCGTVFKITPGGALTTLNSFGGIDGGYPQAGLVQGTNGDFYGTTLEYASGDCGYNCGTVFNINASGKLTTLHSFTGGLDGGNSYPAMIQATDGNFYGLTYDGGAYFGGTIFKMTPSGTLTTLYAFCPAGGLCPDGSYPVGGLVQGNDGNLYGVTAHGGIDYGTVFKITLSGALTTLHTFEFTDGSGPWSRMVEGTDGNFYGLTTYGGASTICYGGCGTIFSITPSGTLTTLYNFCPVSGCPDGEYSSGLFQDTNGTFYGTTGEGGASNEGVIYSLSMGLGPFVKTQTTSGAVGAAVVILGTNLTGATGVTFNGTPATFTVVSSSEITTTVPAGAKTGKVKVTLPHGTLISNANFRVTP
jgi:uncharacterized repeat protein (TIGR03803 family)